MVGRALSLLGYKSNEIVLLMIGMSLWFVAIGLMVLAFRLT